MIALKIFEIEESETKKERRKMGSCSNVDIHSFSKTKKQTFLENRINSSGHFWQQ